jgi:nucleotide-binding universal stress UspA family protein
MKRIVVPTDFSTRSDRAIRRATLMARQFSAEILLVHVVDDDQPPCLIKIAEREAKALLQELAATMRQTDQVPCDARVRLGQPVQAIIETADEVDADLLVAGPHRRQALRDIFVGTTVERIIRQSHRPVIMANAVPAGPYDRILATTDLSDCSADALRTAKELGFFDRMPVTVMHAFDAPAQTPLLRSNMTMREVKYYLAAEEQRAYGELSEFLRKVDLQPTRKLLKVIATSAAEAIREAAHRHKVDLIVMGTQGKSGVAKFLIGSVAEQVWRTAEADVLVVPPLARSPGADLKPPAPAATCAARSSRRTRLRVVGDLA